MKILNHKTNESKAKQSSIKSLCNQSPYLIINAPCGVGRYKFNRIGYNNNDQLLLEYRLIHDDKYKDYNVIEHNIGKYYYLSATQVLYAFKYIASS